MSFLITLLCFFWFARTIKFVLFWIFLWQLKSYHTGRFLDHFRTHKGKKIFFNGLFAAKLILLMLLFINYYLALYVLLLVYVAEFAMFGLAIIKKQYKKPVFTSKTIFLTIVASLDVIFYLFFSYVYIKNTFWFLFLILIYDIFTPLIVSVIVLFFQPFFVMARNNILKKAKKKISQYKNVTVIGITGSYGKTSTKEFLTTILSQRFNVLATADHQNSEIGIAKTILEKLNIGHEIFIVEMGAYNKGGIKLLCNMVKPSIGIVTGVNEQHLSTFGSLDNLLSAEGGRELVDALQKHGLIILNGENAFCVDLYKNIYKINNTVGKQIYTIGKNKIDSDIWTEDIVVEKNSVSFIARTKEKELAHIKVSVPGKQYVQNILGAILIAREFGMTLEQITRACQNIKPEQAGIALKKGVHGIEIIDASYSSNPDGVMADLEYLNIFKGKKVIVMPCLIELGSKSAVIHYQIGKKIAKTCDLAIITTKERFGDLKRGAMENGMQESAILLCDNPDEVLAHITTNCKEGDAVLLEGRVPNKLITLLGKV